MAHKAKSTVMSLLRADAEQCAANAPAPAPPLGQPAVKPHETNTTGGRSPVPLVRFERLPIHRCPLHIEPPSLISRFDLPLGGSFLHQPGFTRKMSLVVLTALRQAQLSGWLDARGLTVLAHALRQASGTAATTLSATQTRNNLAWAANAAGAVAAGPQRAHAMSPAPALPLSLLPLLAGPSGYGRRAYSQNNK